MAEVNVENIEEAKQLFEEKMGFAHDAEGLAMTDDQLVNFLLPLIIDQPHVQLDYFHSYINPK